MLYTNSDCINDTGHDYNTYTFSDKTNEIEETVTIKTTINTITDIIPDLITDKLRITPPLLSKTTPKPQSNQW